MDGKISAGSKMPHSIQQAIAHGATETQSHRDTELFGAALRKNGKTRTTRREL